MTGTDRRSVVKAGAAFIGATAIGFPAIVSGQTDKIKIGHLTPLTGFLGSLGAYAQLGIRMAEEEINNAGGVMGRQIEVMSEDSVNPATATTKAQRMLEQDGATVLMGEINSASAVAIMQVVARNKRLFMQIGARSDALRGKNCNKYTFHVDIPNTVMVNAVGKALLRDNMVKNKKFFTLTADYIFGHDLLRAAKSFFDANGGNLIGDELVPTDVTDFSPYLLKIRQAKPDVLCSNLAGNQVTTLIKQYAEFGLPYPIVGFNLNTADAWAAGEGNLADGLVSHARCAGVQSLRRRLHQEEWQAARKPRLDRICFAQDDGAGHERDQVDRHGKDDRLFREPDPVRHLEGSQSLFPFVGSSTDPRGLSVHGQAEGAVQG
jgi:branched-chain amino acid transport system substrate-binding protein